MWLTPPCDHTSSGCIIRRIDLRPSLMGHTSLANCTAHSAHRNLCGTPCHSSSPYTTPQPRHAPALSRHSHTDIPSCTRHFATPQLRACTHCIPVPVLRASALRIRHLHVGPPLSCAFSYWRIACVPLIMCASPGCAGGRGGAAQAA